MAAQAETKVEIAAGPPFNWPAFILWPFVIALLYLLSFGPVVRMWDKTPFISPNAVAVKFYSPADWTYEFTPLHKPFGMYLHLWDPKYYDKNGDDPTKE